MAKDEKEPAAPPIRPLIPTGVMTPFGELMDDPENPVDLSHGPDVTWTPGYSEQRIARDVAIAEVVAGKRKASDVPHLPGSVRLVRRASPAGQPDGAKQMQSSNNGYRYITKADVGQTWFASIPRGAVVQADGSITKGDCVYMFADAQTAARNSVKKGLATRARLSAAQARAEGAGVSYDSRLMEPLDGNPASRIKAS